ncbi:MAG TPA: hypothetical protein VFY17_03010 [Pilimelia sp.]|nr:hypothetical protein [Pilimelia sp.]
MSAAELARIVDLLVAQVAQWNAARWSAAPEPGGPSRADLVHALAQRLADLAAEVEGQPRRDLPRLDSDLALPDQLRVVTRDLLAAGAPDNLTHVAAADVSEVRAAL